MVAQTIVFSGLRLELAWNFDSQATKCDRVRCGNLAVINPAV